MAQWGETYRINGGLFVINLHTGQTCWDPATANSQIDAFLAVGDGGNPERTKVTEYLLNEFFKGKPWIEFMQWYRGYQLATVVQYLDMSRVAKSPWQRHSL